MIIIELITYFKEIIFKLGILDFKMELYVKQKPHVYCLPVLQRTVELARIPGGDRYVLEQRRRHKVELPFGHHLSSRDGQNTSYILKNL